MAKRHKGPSQNLLHVQKEVTPGLFDIKPVKIEGFEFRAFAVKIVGRPTDKQWTAAFDLASNFEQSAPYWIGDLLRYAEGRDDWRQKFSQMVSVTRLAEQTIHNHTSVARRVKEEARSVSPSFSHTRTVMALDDREQQEWLAKASTEGWTAGDLAREIRSASRHKIIEGQAMLEGMYRVLYADPPWTYGDKPPSGSGAHSHYPGMTIEELCKLPVKAHALPSAVLFMWTTAPLILQNPGPREVIEAWGFTPKTGMVWDKVKHGFGHYVEVRHEHLIIATRGSCVPDRSTPMFPSVQVERRSDTHSEKPESFRKIIERLYDGPYLELFGRKRVDGWDVFGNDARLWADQAAGDMPVAGQEAQP